MKHIFNLSLMRNKCVNHLLRMKCHMKAKTMDIKAMILICLKKLLKKLKNSLKVVFARANENLVAPLAIVLTQPCNKL